MLKRILAPEGSGKTEAVLRDLAEKAAEGFPVYLIVPEQITAEAERAVLKKCGPRAADRVEVCNFSRLSNLVLRKTGGVAKRYLSPTDKELLLAACAQELKEEFHVLNYKNLSDFAREARSALKELQDAGAGRAALSILLKSGKLEGRLREKCEDFLLLDAAYRAELNDRFDDPDEELTHLAAVLKKVPFFKGAFVYVDSFWDFTAQELAVLGEVLRQAESVTVTFCCEKSPSDLFSKGYDAALRVKRMADEAGCPTEDPALPPLQREENALLYCRDRLLDPAAEPYEKPSDEIRLVACRNRFEEARFIAQKIRELVAGGARWREIAVLSRSGAEDDLIGFVFHECGVPCFSEKKRLLAESALAETILKGVSLASRDTRPETLRQYLKNAILPVSEEERFLLKKYAVTWRDPVRAWMSPVPFQRDVEGYVFGSRGEKEEQAAKDELAAVNAAREKVFLPLQRLASGLSGKTVREKVGAVIAYLSDSRVQEITFRKIDEEKKAGDFADAGERMRNWNTVLERLDSLNRAAGERECDTDSFRELLALTLSGNEAGAVPPTQDLVMLGALPFTRQKAKYVFLTGMNAGVFPPEENRSGLLTPRDKAALAEAGIAFPDKEKAVQEEYFLLYLALSFAGEKIWFSFTVGQEKWQDALSPIVKTALALLGRGEEAPVFYDSACEMPRDERSAFRYLCENVEKSRPDLDYLKEYFREKGASSELLDAAAAHAFQRSDLPLKKNLPFPGGDVYTSYSRLETYSKCHYQYFAQYLLKAKPVEKAVFSPASAGSFVHAILEEALDEVEQQGKSLGSLTPEELKELNETVSGRVIREQLPKETDARTAAIIRRLSRSTFQLLDLMRREFAESGFQPIFRELSLSDLGGYRIPLPDGKTLIFSGSIDRVDHYRGTDGKDYVRVVDYKTGGHAFSLADVANGVDMQMLIYLFALMQNGYTYRGERVPKPEPAGILYLNGLFEPQNCLSEKKFNELNGSTPFTRTGLLVDLDELLEVQDPNGKGYLPVYVAGKAKKKKKGLGGILVELEDMGRLKKKVEKDFASLVMEMKKGSVDADPLFSEEHRITPCKYCKYRAMCKKDEERRRAYREVKELSDEDVFGKEEDDGKEENR